jgi:disulfide bond formation protein DsbB
MDLGSLDGGSLLSTEGPSGLVMCDEIVWQFLGLSMAGWNAIFSFVLVGLWVAAARKAA